MGNSNTPPHVQPQRKKAESSFSQSSSSSSTPTSRSQHGNHSSAKSKKSRKSWSKRRGRGLSQGNAVLLKYMCSDVPDIAEAAARENSDSESTCDSDSSDDEMDGDCEHRDQEPGKYSTSTKPSGPVSQLIKPKEEVENQDYNLKARMPPMSSYRTPRIKNDADLDVLPFIKGASEDTLKPLTNSASPSRQASGDVQTPETLPSIQMMLSSIVPRMAGVDIPRCSTPVSFQDDRSPSSTALTRNTFSAQSPLDIQPHQNRRQPPTPLTRHAPPPLRLLSTSSGSTTTDTSARSSSTSTSRTESITPKSLATPSDRLTSDNSPPEQSSPDSTMYAMGVYACHHTGCTAAPFQTQYLLNSHKNVHSSERPHYCPVLGCKRAEGGKGFKRKNEMIRHGLVHSSPGYVCPYCPDRSHTYPRPDNLQRHVSLHHKDKDKRDPSLRDVLAQRPPGMGSSSTRRRRA